MNAIGPIKADLMRCPFCGSQAVLENTVTEAQVRCLASFLCGAKITRKHAAREDTGIALARQAWNRRDGEW